jgi:hypothetical protein
VILWGMEGTLGNVLGMTDLGGKPITARPEQVLFVGSGN